MKPKTRHIVAALLFTAAASFGQLSSPWNFTQDVARAESQQTPMQWFAAETLELNLWSRRLSSAVDFSDPGLKLLWEVVAQTNVQTTWAATTGTVTAATNGAARYSLNNQQANLPAGSYLGFVRAVWTNGTITSNVVLQYQAITVKASANSGLYPVADPITQAHGITGAVVSIGGSVTQSGRTLYFSTPGVFTSLVRGAGSSDRLTVTNGGGTQATINLSVSGLATDNQWRADTERVGLVASNALAGLPALSGLSNSVLAVGLSATGANTRAAQAQVLGTNAYALAVTASNVAASALAGLPSMAALSNGVTSAAASATNAHTKAGQAQVLGTNAYALALQAITNYVESGTGNAITGQVKSAQTLTAYRGTIAASGSGTLTNILRGAGSSTRLSVSNGAGPQVTLHLDASAFATGTPIYVESDPLWVAVSNSIRSDLNAKGTGTVGSLAGVTMQGATHTGNLQAASSAGGHLSNMSGSNVLVWGAGGGNSAQFSGALSINGGSSVATGTPLYVESDPLAITNLQESGSGNAITGSAVVGRSGVLYRGTVAGGSGSETQGFASVQSLGNSAPTVNLQSAYVVIGGNAQFYRHPVYDNGDFSVLVIGGGGADSEGSGRTNNVVSNALDSVILGGNGNRISGPPSGGSGYSVYQQIFGSHASDIGWTDTNIVTKYNSIGGGNNHHVWDSSFATVFGGGGTFIYNSDSVGSLSASHHFFTNCTQVLGLGGVIAMSNRAGVLAYASDWYNDTNALVPNRDNAAHFGVEWIQQTTAGGTYDLFSNGWMVASIISTNNQYNNTNAMPREFGWVGGQRNRFLASLFQPGGTNIFGLVGGGGYSNAWLMSAAQGAVLIGGMSNAALSDISGSVSVGGWNNLINGAKYAAMLGGRSINLSGEASATLAGQGLTISGGWSQGGGRDNIIAANYGNIAGYQNQIQAGAQASVIGGGSTNIIAGPLHGTIGGGTRNLIGSGGTYGTIPGGTSNQVLGVGGFAAGNAAIVSATATGSFFYSAGQLPVTNSTPRSAAFNVPGGFMISGGGSYGADSQQGVSVTNLLLRSDGVSVYTQIVVRGIIIQ